jgi:predicted ATPase
MAKEPEKRYFSTRDLVRDLIAIRDRLTDLQGALPEGQPNNLPPAETPMVGRDRDLVKVKELLERKEVRLVTVTGPGGIGKSRLALETARSLPDLFPGGVYFVPLANLSDVSLIPATLVQTLGVREAVGQSALENLKEHLRTVVSAPLLLLVDNFEHLLEAAPMLAELLAAAPNLKLLVTSRAALHISHEHEFSLGPLALPDTRELPQWEDLSQYPAITLFLERAAAVKPDFRLTEENATSVAEICARLDGLPLAIELAAARVKLLTPSAILTRLARRLQLLTGGARDLPARQQTLRHAMDWSHDLLTEPEQKLFRRLAVFCGGCTLEVVESVCDTKRDLGIDVLDGMASMVDKSLARQVEQADGEPRFTMLETIREYGLEKLEASDEEPQSKRAHAAYCLVLAEEGAAQNETGIQKKWMDRFEVEHDNFRSALDWLTETGNANWGLRLGAALFQFWETREHLTEGRDRLGRLLRLEDDGTVSKARARVLFAAGVLASEQRDYVAAHALLGESLTVAQQVGDKKSVAIAMNAMAVYARDRSDLTKARTQFEQCLTLWRDLGDAPAVARGLSNLASVVELQGDHAHALRLYQECLEMFGQIGDRTGIAWALNHQGDLALERGDFDSARRLYELSLVTFRELDDQWGIAGSLDDLGNLAKEQKDYPRADALYRESLRIFQGLGHKRGVARLLEAFASLAAAKSDGERALRLAGAAAALRQGIGAPPTPAEQAKLERNLARAREGLSTIASRTAWLEGWVMRLDNAIEELLGPAISSGTN